MENKTTTTKNNAGKSKMRKWLSFLLNSFVYFAIIFGILIGLPRFLVWKLDTPYPMAAITSGSMWPDLKEGELVFIKGIDNKNQISIGDIIVFRNTLNDTLTIHRVIELGENTLVTKGDANFGEDKPISYNDVVGKTVMLNGKPFNIPYLGSITVFASNLK